MRHPDVNETIEGWWILHRMFAFHRRSWARVPAEARARMLHEAHDFFAAQKNSENADVGLVQTVGHKADLMITHYARWFNGLAQVQSEFDALEISDFLEPRDSYTSVLELGLYDATAKIHTELETRGLKRFTPEWNAQFDDMLADQERQPRNAGRLWARIPQRRFACFYPMDKKREGSDNWYALPFDERARLMLDHGKIGRTYHGLVTQVISGSIGFDDYEWGVDLYADDPAVFKKLIYEMRFDEASARYAAFGPFVSGVQFSVESFETFCNADGVPALLTGEAAHA
ncbi:MAG TPA: hydrogen peroxide-dependent heme synthase [Candidatus Baltobacteraceae bacterium]|nr:hydrogen peroxide-dependent heme synthase [Candidatus Baltobacteraceae bacterium]